MKKLPSLIAAIAALHLALLPAQATVSESKKLEGGAQFQVDGGGTLRIQFWSPEIVRVTYVNAAELPTNKSFSVVGSPAKVALTHEETDRAFTLASANMKVNVDKQTGAVSFADAAGKPLLKESAQGRKIAPDKIADADVTSFAQTFDTAADEGIYGLGQHQDGAWNYNDGNASVQLAQINMKIAVPVMTSSKGYMLLWDNPAVTTVSSGTADAGGRTLTWSSEFGRSIDYYFCYADGKIGSALKAYRHLTGRAPMLPKWFYGFWQCKERYASQDELLDVAKKYRELKVPVDGVIQDWQYWPPGNNTWGSHQFDPKRYPNPAGMFKELHRMNYHALISVWAKFDLGSDTSKELNAVGGMFPQVTEYAWPKGQGQWYDPIADAGRQTYWKQIRDKIFTKGVDGWWLDAPEPEIKDMEFRTYKTGLGPGYEVYNAYPLMHSKGVYEGQRATTDRKRVVILTRSAFAGQQRNSAINWSGDIGSNWKAFQAQIPAGLNFALTGIPYWNTDTGGFGGLGGRTGGANPDNPQYQELFARWFQFSAFCPMFRVHGAYGLKPGREIWLFDQKTQGIMRSYLDLRYRLLPYLYSTAWQVTSQGANFMRPLVMDHADDPQVAGIGDQYLFGPAIMVKPVTTAGATSSSVYLPTAKAPWYDFWTGKTSPPGQRAETAAPVETVPLFIKPGSIIPMGPLLQYANEKPADPIELRVYRGADGQFTLYEDEGDSYDYEKGEFSMIPINWDEAKQTLTIGKRGGEFPGMLKNRTFNVVLVSPVHGAGIPITQKPDAVVRYNGNEVVTTKR